MTTAQQPVPWEIARRDGMAVASNGSAVLILLQDAEAGRMFVRRAIKGLAMGNVGDRVLPKLNELAGELLQHMDMPAAELAGRLQALAGLAHVAPPQHVEWAVAELDGVKVYSDGVSVVVTRQDMTP